jgi:hypothetical protein
LWAFVEANMRVEASGLVMDAATQPPERRVNAFTGLLRLRSGAFLCGFQSGPAKHAIDSTVRVFRSDDGGVAWRELSFDLPTTVEGVAGSLSSADLAEPQPGKLLMFTTWFDRSEPDRPLFDPVTEGILYSKQLWRASEDEGKTWGPWRQVPTPGLTGTAACITTLNWGDGAVAHCFESYKHFDDPNPGRHGAWVSVTRDGGRTIDLPIQVAQHPEHRLFYWDQRLCVGRAPGEYFGMFWTHDLVSKKDLNVHFRRGTIRDKPPVVPTATPIRGQIAAPLLLDDGRLVAFVVDRERPATMKLWSSPDSGVSWPERDALVVYNHDEQAKLSQGAGRENVDFKEYWNDMAKWSFGHPAIQPLDRDRVLVVWYAGAPGILSVRWARVNVSK